MLARAMLNVYNQVESHQTAWSQPGESDWQLLRMAASHLRHRGAHCIDTDLGQLRLAVQCLHSPQRLCVALSLPAEGVDCADVPSAAAEGSQTWQERAVLITGLVQQLVVELLSSMQVCLRLTSLQCAGWVIMQKARCELVPADAQAAVALLGLSDGVIAPSADVAAAIVADRIIELLAIHAELSAATAAAAGESA